jgi:hypothetical protein
MDNKEYNMCCAFALGYYHARLNGVEYNPYDPSDIERDYYKRGYDKGIVDYEESVIDRW